MAAAIACASTALAGQSFLKPVNELSRKVGNVDTHVTMRKTDSKSSGSIWYGADRPKFLGPFSESMPSYLTGYNGNNDDCIHGKFMCKMAWEPNCGAG